MASSYALPSTLQSTNHVEHEHHHHGHHSHGHSHHTGHNASTHDRKEVLHGTGVALQHGGHNHSKSSTAEEVSLAAQLQAGVLAVTPFLVAALLQHGRSVSRLPHAADDLDQLKENILRFDAQTVGPSLTSVSLVEALIITSATFLLLGLLSAVLPALSVVSPNRSDAVKSSSPGSLGQTVRSMVTSCLPLGFLLFAALQLGGWQAALAALLWRSGAVSARWRTPSQSGMVSALKANFTILAAVLLSVIDSVALSVSIGWTQALTGYLALYSSVLLPLAIAKPAHSPASPAKHGALNKSTSASSTRADHGLLNLSAFTPPTFLVAGLTLSFVSVGVAIIAGVSPDLSVTAIALRTLAIAMLVLAALFTDASALRGSQNAGLLAGSTLSLSSLVLVSSASWHTGAIEVVCLSGHAGIVYARKPIARAIGAKAHDTSVTTSRPQDFAGDARYSGFTQFLLKRCEVDSLVYSILIEKDSRRIAYFTCLNFAFMLVQGLYGYLSGSLGLLSDTVHMFFDCLGLVVGLGAAVASKWPPSPERPFGWGKLNVLAGFGNGIFLMLVSVEFAWEAIEGILDGRELRRVKELLVVSTLGLIINLIGLFAFGHAHAGHDHSHGHSHEHSHIAHHHHEHESHSEHENSHHHDDISPTKSHTHSHDHAGGAHHHHDHNENMHGIFLHVAADAGGSLAVIISTALTLARPWYMWDPLATIIIAILIFAAAVPLVQSSGRKLLLIIPENKEHGVKSFLQEVAEVRGAVSYAAPRFWLNEGAESHDHDHGPDGCHHDHDHSAEPIDLIGSVHIIAAPFADLEDVRERVQDLALNKRIRATVQVEYETDSHCWCSGSQR